MIAARFTVPDALRGQLDDARGLEVRAHEVGGGLEVQAVLVFRDGQEEVAAVDRWEWSRLLTFGRLARSQPRERAS